MVRAVQDGSEEHRVLAFADDLCSLEESLENLQAKINTADVELRRLGLRINSGKYASLHLSRRPLIGVRQSTVKIRDHYIKPLQEGKAASFLRALVGFNIVNHMASLEKITDIGLAILRSKLASWQRLGAIKTYVFPSTVH